MVSGGQCVIMLVLRYALPSVALVNRYSLESRPHHLAVNCNTTLLSIIDVTGLLQFVDLGEQHFMFLIGHLVNPLGFSPLLQFNISLFGLEGSQIFSRI